MTRLPLFSMDLSYEQDVVKTRQRAENSPTRSTSTTRPHENCHRSFRDRTKCDRVR